MTINIREEKQLAKVYTLIIYIELVEKELTEEALWSANTEPKTMGHRKAMGYNDRNDGFLRTFFSRSKWNFSRIRKEHKPLRVKINQQINWIY